MLLAGSNSFINLNIMVYTVILAFCINVYSFKSLVLYISYYKFFFFFVLCIITWGIKDKSLCVCLITTMYVCTQFGHGVLFQLSLFKWSLIDLDVWRHFGNIAVFTCWSCFSQIYTLHIPWWHITYSQP